MRQQVRTGNGCSTLPTLSGIDATGFMHNQDTLVFLSERWVFPLSVLRFSATPFPGDNPDAKLLLFGLVLRLLGVCGDLNTLARVALVEGVIQAGAEDRLEAGLAAADASALVLVVGQAEIALARLQGRQTQS
jgi:hypothetical protein